MTGGLSISLADTNNSGRSEIIVAPKSKGSPQIKMFDYYGNQVGTFFAGELWGYEQFEVRAGSNDILIVAKGSNRGAFYNFDGAFKSRILFSDEIEISSAVAYHESSQSIVISGGAGSAPLISLYSKSGTTKERYFAYGQNFLGGFSIGISDSNGDGVKDIITGAGPSGGPHVRAFESTGALVGQFFAQSQVYADGVQIGTRY